MAEDTISRQCAEELVDLAATIGTMQGMAAAGYGDPDMMSGISDAARHLIEGGICPVSDSDKAHLKALSDRVNELATQEEVELDSALAVQDEMNAALKGILGT